MGAETILHLAQDEKFINAAYYLFEKAFPCANKFVIIKPPANPPSRFLNEQIVNTAQFEIKSSQAVPRLVDLCHRHQVIVLHGLDSYKCAIYSKSANKDRFMTIIYGAEIYNKEIYGEEILGKKSRKLKGKLDRTTVIDVLKKLYRKIAYEKFKEADKVDTIKVLYDMKVYGSLPSYSYKKLISKGIYNNSVKKVPYSYYPLEFIVKDEEKRATGPNILLGNSASATNNHLEALDLLKEVDLQGRKIVAPLSYGSKKYARKIISVASTMFPEKFYSQTQFLPIKEYNELIRSCGIVIMNHYRPEAVGTIIASLYMGAKVFLNQTDAYNYFKKMGCHIYSIEKDLTYKENAFQPLTTEQVEQNRQTLRDELSVTTLIKKMRGAFRDIFQYGSDREENVYSAHPELIR